ncbi:MAG: hypothetical protein ACRBI6_05405 [Acidimicrobiales bacterium]
MLNVTIELPDDVLPIIEGLDVPLSEWVTDRLRDHASGTTSSFAGEIIADAVLAQDETPASPEAVDSRLGRSAPW